MNKDLYFLKLIATALKGDQSSIRLKEALEEIHRMGQQPEYRQGYLQFIEFIRKIIKKDLDNSPQPARQHEDLIQDLVLQFGLGLIESESPETDLIQKFIESNPKWKKEYDRLSYEMQDTETVPEPIEIIFDINGKPLKRIPCPGRLVVDEIGDVSPGILTISLNTGRVLWQGELTARDLFLTEAFPNGDLKLAADTGDDLARVSRKFHVLDGEVTIKVYPEIESGRIEIRIRKSAVE
jgi:hypothetical protein